MPSKKMRNKASRQILGTFAEVSNLIRSSTQVLYDYIKDPNDDYWKWLLLIRKFLKFMLMPEISESQVLAMEELLDKMMNLRDHPFKTLAICMGGGVKNWSNLPTDSSKKMTTEGGRGQKS